MPRLSLIEPAAAEGAAAAVLASTPINIFKGMANNPVMMEGLMTMAGTIAKSGAISPLEAEAVMLRVSERNGCGYCLAAHTKIASGVGVDDAKAASFRRGEGTDDRERALLRFVDAVIEKDGSIEDAELEAFRAAGFDDAAVVDVIAAIAWMTFTNLFNHVNQTEVDFPPVVIPVEG